MYNAHWSCSFACFGSYFSCWYIVFHFFWVSYISSVLILNSFLLIIPFFFNFANWFWIKCCFFRAWVFIHCLWRGRGNRSFSHQARWEDLILESLLLESRWEISSYEHQTVVFWGSRMNNWINPFFCFCFCFCLIVFIWIQLYLITFTTSQLPTFCFLIPPLALVFHIQIHPLILRPMAIKGLVIFQALCMSYSALNYWSLLLACTLVTCHLSFAEEDSLKFLLKWLDRFSQFKGRDFYISGESYGGT